MKKFKTIIFDLDGVIIDSKENMRISWENVRKIFSLRQSFLLYFKHIGYPFKKILEKIGIKNDINKIEKLYKKQSLKNFNKIKIIRGVLKTIKILNKKNIKIAIVTSKDSKRTKLIIKKFKIPIRILISPKKKLRGKPYPDQINQAIRKLKSKKNRCCYVGDMNVDHKTAKNSKIGFIFARYGYQKNKKYYKNMINKPEEILKFI